MNCSLLRSSGACLVALLLAAAMPAEPVAIVPSLPDAKQPQIAFGGDGKIYVVCGRGEEIFLSFSSDEGAHFQLPVKVGSLPDLWLRLRRGPRLAVDGLEVTVTADSGDLFAFHSADGGKVWAKPVRINTAPSSAREGLHTLARGKRGQVYAMWLDLRSGRTEIYGASSIDAGLSWKEERIYRSPDGNVCECCHLSVAFNAQGDLAVMWRNLLGGARDLWAALRPAGESKFGAAAKQGSGSWKLAACPMDGGAVFAEEDGAFVSRPSPG